MERFRTAKKSAAFAASGAVTPVSRCRWHVTSGRHVYTVSASATRKGAAWTCNCQAGHHGILCSHVGAVQAAGHVPTFTADELPADLFERCAEVE